jgi:hypothetical protein
MLDGERKSPDEAIELYMNSQDVGMKGRANIVTSAIFEGLACSNLAK